MDVELQQPEQEVKETSSLEKLFKWATSRYEFRRDVIKGRILYRKAGSTAKYEVLQDEQMNTIAIEATFRGLKTANPANLQLLLFSHLTPSINPVTEYLERVAKRHPVGTIAKLAGHIKTSDDVLFLKYLKKWLASSVANALNTSGCQNHCCLTFTGPQGKGKTSFFEWLCPPELIDYLFTGDIDLNSKDSLWKLAEYWLLNIEEQIKSLNKGDANKMKQLITLPAVKGRRPYGRLEAQAYRLANFLASTNENDLLFEKDVHRRFLCFKILSIDLAYRRINVDDVWAEAFHYYIAKPDDYYVNGNDYDELAANNAAFVHVTDESQYVANFFHPGVPDKPHFLLQSTTIRDFISTATGNKVLKEKNIGSALKDQKFENVSHRFTWAAQSIKVWRVAMNGGVTAGQLEKYHANANNQFKP